MPSPPSPRPMIDRIDEAAIALLVERFYGRALQDPELGPVFAAAVSDWPAHYRRLADFWSSLMLGTGRYKGNPFSAHLGKGVRPELFPLWLDLWRQTTAELFTPEIAAAFDARAERIGDSLTSGLFFRPPDGDTPSAP
jgi:hemoglobin